MSLIAREDEPEGFDDEMVLGEVEVPPYKPPTAKRTGYEGFSHVEGCSPTDRIFRPTELILEHEGLPLDVRHPLRVVNVTIGMDPLRGRAPREQTQTGHGP